MDLSPPSPARTQPPRKPPGVDHRLEDLIFPVIRGWKHAGLLFLYYILVIVALLLIYGRGDFSTAPFIYQGF